ncbi:DMT family transporter, partial [Salmonella enterica]|nr:DMT family transporter [Salmonella enterica]
KKIPLNSKAILAYATGIFEPFLAYTFTLYGLNFVSAGGASVIFSLESVFIIILSVIIFSVKIHSPLYFILFLIGAMVGSVMVALPDVSNERDNAVGYFLVVAGVLSAAFYVVISSQLIKAFEPITLLSGQLTFSFIISSVFVFITKPPIYLPLESFILVFLSGVLQYFLAFCFYLNSLRWLPVHIAGVMLYFIPVFALFLSWLFLGEKFTFIQVGGFIVTVLSVYFLNRKYSED